MTEKLVLFIPTNNLKSFALQRHHSQCAKAWGKGK